MTETKVLVTGAAGFVGRHLCACLQQKNISFLAGVQTEEEAARMQLPREQLAVCDITDRKQVREMVKKAKPDAVIHLAGQASVALSFQKPELTRAVNVEGTRYLLEELWEQSPAARILLIGSVDQYGCVPEEEQPITEEHPLTGQSPYGQSKREQEALALAHVKTYGQNIVLVRAAAHIGQGQARTFAVADWAAQVKEMQAGLRQRCLRVGNLQVVRDIADVRDVVMAYLALLSKGVPGEIYNVGTGTGVCLADIPPLLARLSGITDLQAEVDESRFRPADIPILIADNTKLRRCTGWEPLYSLEDTLRWMLD